MRRFKQVLPGMSRFKPKDHLHPKMMLQILERSMINSKLYSGEITGDPVEPYSICTKLHDIGFLRLKHGLLEETITDHFKRIISFIEAFVKNHQIMIDHYLLEVKLDTPENSMLRQSSPVDGWELSNLSRVDLIINVKLTNGKETLETPILTQVKRNLNLQQLIKCKAYAIICLNIVVMELSKDLEMWLWSMALKSNTLVPPTFDPNSHNFQIFDLHFQVLLKILYHHQH